MAFTAAQHEKIKTLLEPLKARFPALQQCLPLALDTKQRLPEVAAEFDVAKHLITKTMGVLTQRKIYQQALAAPDSMRHTLEGVPVEPVSEDHRAFAQSKLDAIYQKRPQPAKKGPRPAPAPTLPLTPEQLTEILTMAIPGKLDVTLKINELPVVKSLGTTVAFAIQADGRNVVVELKNKAWNTLKTTAEGYPVWVAAISGKMGKAIEGGFQLENPAVQIFEKKAKTTEEAAPQPVPTETVAPKPVPTVTKKVAAPAPESSTTVPTINAQKPVLKLRKPAA